MISLAGATSQVLSRLAPPPRANDTHLLVRRLGLARLAEAAESAHLSPADHTHREHRDGESDDRHYHLPRVRRAEAAVHAKVDPHARPQGTASRRRGGHYEAGRAKQPTGEGKKLSYHASLADFIAISVCT